MYDIAGARRLTEFELALAARLRGLEAGARRQRRLGAVPARRLRRGAVAPSTPRRKNGAARARGALADRASAHRVPRAASGSGPTTASGRCAAGAGTSPTRRSWPGWPSIAAVQIIEEFGDRRRARARACCRTCAALRERIHEEVCERGFNPRVGAFTQSYGSEALDASVLLMPHIGFLPATDPRMQGTVAAIEKKLLRDGFVLRYSTETGADGLPGHRGRVPRLQLLAGGQLRLRRPHATRRRRCSSGCSACATTSACSPRSTTRGSQRQIGNFPQAFSHLALIFTAHIIESCRQGRANRRRRWPASAEGEGGPRPHVRCELLIRGDRAKPVELILNCEDARPLVSESKTRIASAYGPVTRPWPSTTSNGPSFEGGRRRSSGPAHGRVLG